MGKPPVTSKGWRESGRGRRVSSRSPGSESFHAYMHKAVELNTGSLLVFGKRNIPGVIRKVELQRPSEPSDTEVT